MRHRPDRFVGGAGILFVILYAAPSIFWGGVRADEQAAKVAQELVRSRSAAVAAAYVLLGASVFLLIFAAGMSRVGRDAAPANPTLSVSAFGAGAISAALLAVANAVMGALAGYLIDGAASDTVRSLNGIWDALTTASGLFLGAFAVLVSLLAFQSHALATWMRWMGIVVGLLLIVGAGSLATPFHGVGPFWVLGVIGTLLWIAATSVSMVAGRSTPAR